MSNLLTAYADAYCHTAGEIWIYADLLMGGFDPAWEMERLRKSRALRAVISCIDEVPELTDWLAAELQNVPWRTAKQ